MSCNLIYLHAGQKLARPVTSRQEYLALRNTPAQHTNLTQARTGNDTAKRRLVQFNYSCQPDRPSPGLTLNGGGADTEGPTAAAHYGVLKGCKTPSNTVGMDVDLHRADFASDQAYATALAEIPARILAKKDELGLLMLERSATKGFHLVFRRRFTDGLAEGRILANQEQNLRWASQLLGVEFDQGAKDLTRVFFTTTASPDDLLFLHDDLFLTSAAPSASPEAPSASPSAPVPSVFTEAPSAPSAPVPSPSGEGPVLPPSYLGLSYPQIIRKWWDLYNHGQEPCPGNRNTLTFELAVNLRHICGFDRELLNQVIPDYWANDPARRCDEKLACIDSALAERRTQMPRRLKDVLQALRNEALHDLRSRQEAEELVTALDGALQADELYHYDRLPRLPQGVRDSVEAAGHSLAMPTLVAIAPAIGTLATGVKLDVHGCPRGLNLCSFIVGDFASGKGQMDSIIAAWMTELQAEADIYTAQEEEWARKTSRMKSGKAPEQPRLPVRMLTLNNTVANISARLSNAEGKHSFSFTPEADNVALKWKQSVSDFSVMLRQAYDEARYDREAKSADAVRVHIDKLLWNVTMCGTQDALYRVITNYTDGLLSRLAIARTPDNTFSPLVDRPAQMTSLLQERIRQVAHLLPLMQGTVVLPKLEDRGRQWLETIRLEAMKNDDRVLARQRMRGCVNAMRVTTALWLPRVAELLIKKHGLAGAEQLLKKEPEVWIDMLRRQQSADMLQLFDIVADYLIDNDLYYFRTRIEHAYESRDFQGGAGRHRQGRNDTIYERLDPEFTFDQALQHTISVKGTSATRNSVHQMLKNWRHQGLIFPAGDGRYKKKG